MHNLDLAFGSPWKSYKTIHVAGTNGKGSVSTKIASALSQLGFKTGLYTSPHIETFHERIQIDGKMISFEDAEYFLVKILEVSREATFFEVMTMLAFFYFQSKEVDYAVIETGIGGTLDPTNILIPVLSVITSISYDHMAILGDTLDEIASNKAGIIKQRTPVVISSRANFDSIYKKAFQENAPLHVAEASDDWCKENTEIAKKVISLLFPGHPSLDFSALPPCRFEIHNYGGIPLIFDIAHNKDGFKKLFQKIENAYPDKKIFSIFGMSQDKCVEFAISFLKAKSAAILPIDTDNTRLMRKADLNVLLGQKERGIEEFLQLAKKEEGVLVVTGSAYIMHPAKKLLNLSHIQSAQSNQALEKCCEPQSLMDRDLVLSGS